MESKQHIDQFSEGFIRKYLDGKLSPAQEHRLEKAMLEDPFLADAVEGLNAVKDSGAVNEVKSRVRKSLGFKKSPVVYLVAIAIIITGSVFLIELNSEKTPTKAEEPVTTEISEGLDQPTLPESEDKKMVDAGKTDSSISFAFEVDKNLEEPEVTERFVEVKRQEEIPPMAAPIKNFDSLLAASSDKLNLEVERPKGNSIYHIENYKVVDYRQLRSVLFTEQDKLHSGLSPNAENEDDNEPGLLENGSKEEVAYTQFLEEAMIEFANGSYKRALNDFETILKSYPKDANALFYGGMAAYNSGDFSKAEELMRKSLDSSIGTFSEESEFYLAKTLLARGKTVEAEELFNAVVAKRGFYHTQAKALLKTL
ncbi:tetratricopeptide repeat protein [Halocola ammonii]